MLVLEVWSLSADGVTDHTLLYQGKGEKKAREQGSAESHRRETVFYLPFCRAFPGFRFETPLRKFPRVVQLR